MSSTTGDDAKELKNIMQSEIVGNTTKKSSVATNYMNTKKSLTNSVGNTRGEGKMKETSKFTARKTISLMLTILMLLTMMPMGALFAAFPGTESWAGPEYFRIQVPNNAIEITFNASSINSHTKIERVFWVGDPGSRTGTIYMYVSCKEGQNPSTTEGGLLNSALMADFASYKNRKIITSIYCRYLLKYCGYKLLKFPTKI